MHYDFINDDTVAGVLRFEREFLIKSDWTDLRSLALISQIAAISCGHRYKIEKWKKGPATVPGSFLFLKSFCWRRGRANPSSAGFAAWQSKYAAPMVSSG